MKPLEAKQMCQYRLVAGPESPCRVGVARALIGHSDGRSTWYLPDKRYVNFEKTEFSRAYQKLLKQTIFTLKPPKTVPELFYHDHILL